MPRPCHQHKVKKFEIFSQFFQKFRSSRTLKSRKGPNNPFKTLPVWLISSSISFIHWQLDNPCLQPLIPPHFFHFPAITAVSGIIHFRLLVSNLTIPQPNPTFIAVAAKDCNMTAVICCHSFTYINPLYKHTSQHIFCTLQSFVSLFCAFLFVLSICYFHAQHVLSLFFPSCVPLFGKFSWRELFFSLLSRQLTGNPAQCLNKTSVSLFP